MNSYIPWTIAVLLAGILCLVIFNPWETDNTQTTPITQQTADGFRSPLTPGMTYEIEDPKLTGFAGLGAESINQLKQILIENCPGTGVSIARAHVMGRPIPQEYIQAMMDCLAPFKYNILAGGLGVKFEIVLTNPKINSTGERVEKPGSKEAEPIRIKVNFSDPLDCLAYVVCLESLGGIIYRPGDPPTVNSGYEFAMKEIPTNVIWRLTSGGTPFLVEGSVWNFLPTGTAPENMDNPMSKAPTYNPANRLRLQIQNLRKAAK